MKFFKFLWILLVIAAVLGLAVIAAIVMFLVKAGVI